MIRWAWGVKPGKLDGPEAVCGQSKPKLAAVYGCWWPIGCGAAKRSSPTGGFAYGMPRYSITHDVPGAMCPVAAPLDVDTVRNLFVLPLLQLEFEETPRTEATTSSVVVASVTLSHCAKTPAFIVCLFVCELTTETIGG